MTPGPEAIARDDQELAPVNLGLVPVRPAVFEEAQIEVRLRPRRILDQYLAERLGGAQGLAALEVRHRGS